MSIECREIQNSEWLQWDDMVAESPQGTIFHTTIWKQVIDRAYESGRYLLVGAFGPRGLMGGCVALERPRMGQHTAVTPLLTPYIGFLIRESATDRLSDRISQRAEVLECLGKWMCSRFSYQHLVNGPELDDMRQLLASGYHVAPRYTYEVDLTIPAGEQWLRFDGHVRRHIKKGEKADFTISDELSLGSAFELFESTFRRHDESCPVEESFFREIIGGELLKPYRTIVAAYHTGELGSYITALHYKGVAYYALASTSHTHLQTGVSSMMMWNLINELQKLGCHTLDLVGANIPSIARFKEGFNPRLRVFYQTEHYRGIHLKLGRKLVRLARK